MPAAPRPYLYCARSLAGGLDFTPGGIEESTHMFLVHPLLDTRRRQSRADQTREAEDVEEGR